MPETDLELLLRAGEIAGRIAMRYFKNDPQTWEKADDAGPVTQADLECDAALKECLLTARPDYGWLSEETEDTTDRLSKSRVFVVDPIDGTRSFINGHIDFSHSLAIVENGQPVAAVVHLPARAEVFCATQGGGAFLNDASISASQATEVSNARILAAKPQLDPKHWSSGPPPIDRHFRSSLAYRLCLVAQGRFDGMLTLRPSWEWDIAAGALIAAEAGAVVTDGTGGSLTFNSTAAQTQGIIAAPASIHTGVMAYL